MSRKYDKRASPKTRAAFKADLAQILMAEHWPVEALPVLITVSPWRAHRDAELCWSVSVVAQAPVECLAGASIFSMQSYSHPLAKMRIAQRARAWVKGAYAAGIRKLEVGLSTSPSGHQGIAAEIAAAKWDAA